MKKSSFYIKAKEYKINNMNVRQCLILIQKSQKNDKQVINKYEFLIRL
jgi:hypothetical protein